IGGEEPGYAKIAAIYASLGLRCAWIPMEQDGISLDVLQKSGADAVHISPSHHFPTGAITSIGKRYALLGWAAEGRYIIEDDYDSEFRLAGKPIPSLFSIDVTDRVIYMNTFSKSLTPTIRISYMILPFPLLERYRTSLSCYSCAVSTFEQYTLASFIKKGYFEKHIHRMRKHCRDSRDSFFTAVQDSPLFRDAVITGTSAGLHCLVTFDTDLPDTYLLEEAQKMDLHASLLSSYFHVPPTESLHQLVIEY
ncbi:MAG: PLP-dependent aminotransferase family protein, partial [Oscillospiraceae bacterium]|nr:PLP-dependent aminotransferase family protein [Oscillospiraceae bacterium]